MKLLIIGGTRNLGHSLTHALISGGHTITVFNRGKTRDELPDAVERIHGDRTDAGVLRRALRGRLFDAVIDTTLYKEGDAQAIVEILNGAAGHYVFLSSGQVYLVRQDIERPFVEDDYHAGRPMPPPIPNTFGYEEWLYGMDKRRCEDVLSAAWDKNRFPYTTLRLPMVNSERDHFGRLYNYILRLEDGSPILAPETPNFRLRHVYGDDVVRAVVALIEGGRGKGRAFNLSQEETVSLDEFLTMLGGIMGVEARIRRFSREQLDANGFLPNSSPFSERWMSELDNVRSKTELGVTYTPLREYLERIVAYYRQAALPTPIGYTRRHAELTFMKHTPPPAAVDDDSI